MPALSQTLHVILISRNDKDLAILKETAHTTDVHLHITQVKSPQSLLDQVTDFSVGYVLFCSLHLKRQYDSALRTIYPSAIFEHFSPELLQSDNAKSHLLQIAELSTARHHAALAYDRLSLAAQIIESAMEGIFIIDTEGIVRLINPSFTSLTGYIPEDILGLSLRILNTKNHGITIEDTLTTIIDHEEPWQGELWIRNRAGKEIPLHVTVNPLHSDQPHVEFVVMFTDISEKIQSEKRFEQIAFFDPVTNLPNRTHLQKKLIAEIETAMKKNDILAVIYLDLDRFKNINDTLGHGIGDILLQQVASRLQNCLPGGNTLARLGGDEFVFLIPHLSTLEEASARAELIILEMQAPFLCETFEVHVTLSLGISLFPNNGSDSTTLFKNAEIALYRAKKYGGNTYQFYTPTLNPKALERFALENSLRHAISRNEFVLYYQPQISLLTGVISGVEALIRWQHPDLGLISPADFLPLAEETGMILPISEWVLTTACHQAVTWKNMGLPPVTMSVNLSSQQLRDPHFAEKVQSVLASSKLDPAFLDLELTENIIMENPEQTINLLQTLKKIGIRFSIDDFGTGYSSLSHLKRFPLTTLKIDRSFIADCPDNDEDAAIISAITSMSHILHLSVIAEGVETEEQLKILTSLHCDTVQGYYFSKPVPANKIPELSSFPISR